MLGSRITITQEKVDEAALWVRVFEHFKAYCKHELCQNKEGSTESVAAQCVLHSLEQIGQLPRSKERGLKKTWLTSLSPPQRRATLVGNA